MNRLVHFGLESHRVRPTLYSPTITPTGATWPWRNKRTWKFLLTAALLVLLTTQGFAQGTVIVNNSSAQLVLVGQDPGPAGVHVAFYYSPTPVTDPSSPALHLIPNGVGTLVSAGRFLLGTKTTDTDAAPGSTIYASVRAWTGNYPDWSSACTAWLAGTAGVCINSSPVFTMPTGGAGIPPSPPVSLSTVAAFTGLTLCTPPPPPPPTILVGAPEVRGNQFGFTVSCASYYGVQGVSITACTNLANPYWESLLSVTVGNGSFEFTDPDWTNYPSRFYRVWSH